MEKIIYTKEYNGHRIGDTEEVLNNVALGLIEKEVAVLFRNYRDGMIHTAPRNKMMKPETTAQRRARQRGKVYIIK